MRTAPTSSCTSRPADGSPKSSPRCWPITPPGQPKVDSPGSRRDFGQPQDAIAHRPPGEAAGDAAEPAIRGQPDRLQQHRDPALDMVRVIEPESAARVGAAVALPVVGTAAVVGCVI